MDICYGREPDNIQALVDTFAKQNPKPRGPGIPNDLPFIWDAKRSIDYLVSRPEVDPARIGAAGCSGGGALTTFIGALDPRLKYADEQFEFAYALSVFTHTPETLQQPWIDELWRVLRPGGYLLMTTQGNEFLGKLSAQERNQYHEGRIVVRFENAAGTNLCSTYHPQSYVRQKLAGKFSLALCRAGAARGNGNQDIYLLRKSSMGAEHPQRSFHTAGLE